MKRLFSNRPKDLTIHDHAQTFRHPYSSSAGCPPYAHYSMGTPNTASSSSLTPLITTPAALRSPAASPTINCNSSTSILLSAGPRLGGYSVVGGLDVGFDGELEPTNTDRRASEGTVKSKVASTLAFRGRGRSVSFAEERRPSRIAPKSRSRQRDQSAEEQVKNKITYLIASASEDMTLVMDICQSASLTDATAKEAVRSLRQEFKYGDPMGQLAATKLWAVMLRHSSSSFIQESTSKKFLSTLESLLTSPDSSPVVRDRLLEVLGAAAYASGQHERGGFRGLWLKVKPADKPDKGVPLQSEDQVFPLSLDQSRS